MTDDDVIDDALMILCVCIGIDDIVALLLMMMMRIVCVIVVADDDVPCSNMCVMCVLDVVVARSCAINACPTRVGHGA
jgi:hypothetical protein